MQRVKSRRWLFAAAGLPLILAACTSMAGRQGAGTGTVAGSGSAAPGGLGAVRHVWVIELENKGYAQSFGTPAADPYLAQTLPRMGALLENYYAIGHSSAANYIAQVSGQAPSLGTQADCPLWTPFPGQVIAGPYRQVLGEAASTRPRSRRWATSCPPPGAAGPSALHCAARGSFPRRAGRRTPERRCVSASYRVRSKLS